MAQALPTPPPDKKRVKVYELKNNDWFDRGTGFCTASFYEQEPRVLVESEDEPERMLLETKICKEDGFQKQQDTLILWTEPSNGVDMALSFQEAEGCAVIWKFVNNIQRQLLGTANLDDTLSDDMNISPFVVSLPNPELGNLEEVEAQVRTLSSTQAGRDGLTKFVINDDYIPKLIPLVELAEDFESLADLHRLCNIMKTLLLLNDTAIIEYSVTDEVILGVVGALEYDPDFPSHKANHRQWLADELRYKEVVQITDEQIQKKIHHTYRLQYLKDVVLARILDDPTYSVLNSLIFFNQVDIVQHLQTNPAFLTELFGIFDAQNKDAKRKKDAVLFIQQCCVIAKNLQAPARQQLYNQFLNHGLFQVINFGLRHSDVGVRVGATDVLVAMIDHDPQMIRQTMFRQISEKTPPLTDSLIDLLLVEVDLGVKAHIADAIKVLLDPAISPSPIDGMTKAGGDFNARLRSHPDPQQELFLANFYEESAKKLFKPLVDLKGRENMIFTPQQVSLFIHLVETLCFFIRQHQHRSKYFVLSENLGQRIAQLLSSPEKHLKLTALKFFRNLVNLQDEFYNQQMMQERLFEPILDIVHETMPRDNLLNSACLELFEFIKREDIKVLISHIVENYRDRIKDIIYVDTFTNLIASYDQSQGFNVNMETSFLETEEDTPQRSQIGDGRRWQGVKDLDAAEEEYFNTSSDDEENADAFSRGSMNGSSPLSKPLVDYPSDEEGENQDAEQAAISDEHEHEHEQEHEQEPEHKAGNEKAANANSEIDVSPSVVPPERLSEKRRREEDEEDELGKLSANKRRSSTSSISSVGSNNSKSSSPSSDAARRRKSFGKDAGGSKKIAISISSNAAIKTGGDAQTSGGD